MEPTTPSAWPPDREAVEAAVLRGDRERLEEAALGEASDPLARAALLALASPELYDLGRALADSLGRFRAGSAISTFPDEGIIGLRVAVPLRDDLTIVAWIREEDGAYKLLLDHDTDAPAPTPFASRTRRAYSYDEAGLRALRRDLLTVVTVILPGDVEF